MARIRTIKPEFFVSESLSEVSLTAERTFAGLITQVDDEGRYKDNAAILCGAIWALRPSHTAVDVEDDLMQLAAAGLICRYTANGKRYLHLVTFGTHQKISHPTKSKLPCCPDHNWMDMPPEQDSRAAPQSSGFSPEDFGAAPIGSGSGSGSGMEVEGEGITPAPRKRAARTVKPPAAEPDAEPDPEVQARADLARQIVQWWWEQLAIKPSGKRAFHVSARVVDNLLAVGHEPKAVAAAAREIGSPITTARMEMQLGRAASRASPPRRATVDERMDQTDQALAELKADRANGVPVFGYAAANPNNPAAIDLGPVFREIEP